MNKKLIIALSALTILAMPLAAMAFDPGVAPTGDSSLTIATIINRILGFLWPIFAGFAVIMFLIAGFQFLMNKPDEGRQAVLWGVVGVVVGLLAFSIPYIVRNVLNVG